jgi:hypothetical protein
MVKQLTDHSASGEGVHSVRLFGRLLARSVTKGSSALSFAHRLESGSEKNHLTDLINSVCA